MALLFYDLTLYVFWNLNFISHKTQLITMMLWNVCKHWNDICHMTWLSTHHSLWKSTHNVHMQMLSIYCSPTNKMKLHRQGLNSLCNVSWVGVCWMHNFIGRVSYVPIIQLELCQGKKWKCQGNVREKSGNLIMEIEWEPCYNKFHWNN